MHQNSLFDTTKIYEKYLESNCIKNELLKKDFLSIMLKLKVTSRDSNNNVFAKRILMTKSAFIRNIALAMLTLIVYSYI